MKKILSSFLALTMIFGIFQCTGLSVTAFAASESDLTFELSWDGESYEITDCNESASGELVIPSEYNGLQVTRIGDSAFEDCESLKSITIPDSVTYIDWRAFKGCTSLESVIIPESATYIGESVFEGCTSLKSITIPDGVTYIDWRAFKGCTSLTSATIPESVNYIGSYAFSGCSLDLTIIAPKYSKAHVYALENSIKIIFNGESQYLKYGLVYDGWDDTYKEEYEVEYCSEAYEGEPVIPSEYNGLPVTRIGDSAFEDCTSLTSITIPESVTEIGDGAFENCTSLESITIPESVTYIGDSAFEGCTSLKEINIPDNATYVNKGTFSDTAYYNDNSNWENGVLYIGNNLVAAKESVSGSYIVKNGTVIISHHTFENCTNLESITIPESVTYIDNSAFKGCTSLVSVTMPKSVTEIGEDAFSGCSSDLTIIAPKYSYANDYAIENSKKFVSNGVSDCLNYQLNYYENGYIVDYCSKAYEGEVVIPSEYNGLPVTGIGDGAFSGCSEYLTSVTIPESVTEIGDRAFYGCRGFIEVIIPEGVTKIGKQAFQGCTNLISIVIPKGVTEISGWAFYGCTNLKSVTLSVGIKCLNDYTFKDCTSLESIIIPEGVERLGWNVFENCTNLKSITIPESMTDIGILAFRNTAYCQNTSNWEGDVLYIGGFLYAARENITGDYKIKNGTKGLALPAFAGCTSLTAVTIPDSVKDIGYAAFSGCSNLKSIAIPKSVRNIYGAAFQDCTNLEEVTIPENVIRIETDAFTNCTNLKSVTILRDDAFIHWWAFDGCTNLTISGYKNSTSQKYAEEYGFAFNALGTVVADGESDIKVIGDVDENAALNVTLLNSDESKITYDITLTKDGKEIQPNGTVKVKIPVPEGLDGTKCRVYRAEADGSYTDVNAKFENGFMVFETTHFSEYVLTVDDLSVAYGDVNGDGKITAVDLAMLKKYLANRDPVTGESTVTVKKGADVNGDGKITAVDLAMLKKYLANRDPLTGESTVTLGPKK